MLFHNNFEDRYLWCNTPNWFELKSKLYADICTWKPRKLDEVFFHFKAPNAGWMDYVFLENILNHIWELDLIIELQSLIIS